MEPVLVLIDGLPGTGKSTLAERLGSLLPFARVYLENRGENPLHAFEAEEDVAAFAGINDFSPREVAELSLAAVQRFVASAEPGVHVAESFPFQSAVRLLIQMGAERSLIRDFYNRFEETVRPMDPRLIFLRHPEGLLALGEVARIRGDAWLDAVCRFVEESPWARGRELAGREAVDAMMADYAGLIEELLAGTRLPVLQLEGGRAFGAATIDQAHKWIESAGLSRDGG